MGESGSRFLKNEWEWVVFLEKLLRAGCFCRKMGGSGLFFLKNEWEWVRAAGSGWEWVRVAGSGWEWVRVAGSAIR